MSKKYTFCIAEHYVVVEFEESCNNSIELLPSFNPFIKEDNDGCLLSDTLFSIKVDDNLRPINPEHRKRVDTFDTGNGMTVVDNTSDGGYQFIINDIRNRSCCLLLCNNDFTKATCALNGTTEMRRFGLNNAIMMMYAFRSSFFSTLLIHASLVRNNGYGYAFIAKSGTGKSTHTSLWMKHIEGCDLMNDDNPIVRIINDKAFIYGSPWSGKTPCYRNTKAPLGAITKIERAQHNWVEKMSPTIAFTQILPACSSMKWDNTIYRNTYNTVIKLIEVSPGSYMLHCLPDEEAARVCYDTIAIK